jgi:hypothetical protein
MGEDIYKLCTKHTCPCLGPQYDSVILIISQLAVEGVVPQVVVTVDAIRWRLVVLPKFLLEHRLLLKYGLQWLRLRQAGSQGPLNRLHRCGRHHHQVF